MGTHKLLENIFFFEKRIADNLEVFYRYLGVVTTFEDISVVMFGLILKIYNFQAIFIDFFLSGLHEALHSKQRKIGNNSLIDQLYVVNHMLQMDLVMRKRIVFRCIELVLNRFAGVGFKFRNNIEELISVLDYLRVVYLFLVVGIVEVANFDDGLEKNGIKVEQIVAFFEVKAIESKIRVDSLYIFYQASNEGENIT